MKLSSFKLAVLACAFSANFFTTQAQVHTFTYTGSSQSWIVPPTVTSVIVDVVGATGGRGQSVLYGTVFYDNVGGAGGRVQCVLSVTPGSELMIVVGGKGDTSHPGTGGFNGGGSGHAIGWGGGGGGASDIRMSPYTLSDRVVVAGGGGGGGGLVCPGGVNILGGGDAGGITGSPGHSCYSSTEGKGGTDTAGGAGGFNGTDSAPSGTLGLGGHAAAGYYGSAGGGGGYYGGGGSINAGGGGGSSWADTSVASDIVNTADYNGDGDGMVTITEVPPAGINSLDLGSVILFPNPATDILTIYPGSTTYDTYSITNSFGQTLAYGDMTSLPTQVNLRLLPGGVYYITLRGRIGNTVRRFIKQ